MVNAKHYDPVETAEALVEMGAKLIDVAVVKNLLRAARDIRNEEARLRKVVGERGEMIQAVRDATQNPYEDVVVVLLEREAERAKLAQMLVDVWADGAAFGDEATVTSLAGKLAPAIDLAEKILGRR